MNSSRLTTLIASVVVAACNGLEAYTGTGTIRPDPYDVSVALAKMADEHGPCCRCWRWSAFEGQAKQFIRLRRSSAALIARIWNLEDGCGSGSMMTQ